MNTTNQTEVLCAGVKKAPAAEITIGSIWMEVDESSNLIFLKVASDQTGRAVGLNLSRDEKTGKLSIWNVDAVTYISPGDPHVEIYNPLATGASHE